jgi:eukaryotic-like serine/threonine-protein kinase
MARQANRLIANRYALVAPLGRGGMGVVWRAQDSVLGREVAIKEVVFPPTLAEQERRPARARVLREARAAARLNHPAAVTLYDVVQDQGGTFIVMELVNAPTLAELVRHSGPLPVERVAELGAQLAGALEAAHQAGIVHRDVKPGNVMVAERGPAKLADFGIASLQGDPQLTSTGLVIGSPAYMAPEQAKGEASGPAADFWALGATLFYAVEGEPPFDRGSSIATLTAVVNDPPRRPQRAGPLAPLLTALLAKDPSARPTGPALRAELDRLTARPAPPTEVLPVHGPGRTVPLPAPPAGPGGTQEHPTPIPPAGAEAEADEGVAGAVDSPEHPTGPSATLPPGGAGHREVGLPAAGSPGAAAAGAALGPAAVGSGSEAGGRHPGAARPTPGTADPNPDPAPSPLPVLPPAPVVDRGDRRRVVAAAALLVVLALAAVLLVNNLRSTGDGDPTAAPTTAAAGGGGTRGTQATTPEATSATAAPTSTAPTTAAPNSGLAEGWTKFTNRPGANRVGVPPGFRARTRKTFNATVVEERDDPERVFTVRSQNPSAPLPQTSRDYRAYAERTFEDFREVRYDEGQTYAGHGGAVVFEYEAVRDGRRVHVSHINLKGRSWGYNVEFIAPADQWDASQELARQFEQAFQPLG